MMRPIFWGGPLVVPKVIPEEEIASDLNDGNIPFKSNTHSDSEILILKFHWIIIKSGMYYLIYVLTC